MLTLATVSLPANSPASSSSAGPIILQGPHHSAQKSTSTGPSAFSTSWEKVWSDTALVFALILNLDGSVPFQVGPANGRSSSSSGSMTTCDAWVQISAQLMARPG